MKHAKSYAALFFTVFTLHTSAQVGIGTTTPLARLHVADSSVLFSAAGSVPVSPGAAPTSGGGRRMMWYADKAAFRTGFAFFDEWNTSNIGNYSFGAGFNVKANGFQSVAIGDHLVSSGLTSIAIGTGDLSSGSLSVAIGYNDTSTATNSVAIGSYAVASGVHSLALGNFVSTNLKDGAFVLGDNSTITFMISNANNEMSMRFAGGYRLFTNTALTSGLAITGGSGFVGIGTFSPVARLQVADSSVVFTASGLAAASPGNSPVTGAGRRMMWYADKGAFRAGYAAGAEWDAGNTGNYSLAAGYGNTAAGYAATALGQLNNAAGNSSTAIGQNTSAAGNTAVAAGYNTSASGDYSTAMGTYVSTNSQNGSFVVGDNSTVSVMNSAAANQMSMRFSGGYRLFTNAALSTGLFIAAGTGAVGIGTNSPIARLQVADSSVVFNASGYPSGPYGNTPINGAGRRMMWYADKAAFRAGYVAGVEWDGSNIGLFSLATGIGTEATNEASVAFGYYTSATGAHGVAMGMYSLASGQDCMAMGYACFATGANTLAAGQNNTASGTASFALGSYTSTNSQSGAFAFGDNSTTSTLQSSTLNEMSMRFAGGYRLYSNSGMTTGVILAAGGGAWGTVSDRRKKENFQTINTEDILQKVAALPLSNWNYKSQPATQRHIGPMAQDFYAAFQLDGIGADTTINTTDIDGVNMAAIQALEKRTRDGVKPRRRTAVATR